MNTFILKNDLEHTLIRSATQRSVNQRNKKNNQTNTEKNIDGRQVRKGVQVESPMTVEGVGRVERFLVLHFRIMRVGPDLKECLTEDERAWATYIATDEPREKKEDAENLQLIDDERGPSSMLDTCNQPVHERLFRRVMLCHTDE